VTVESAADDHKAYYPGSHRITIRVTGDRTTGRLLGMQARSVPMSDRGSRRPRQLRDMVMTMRLRSSRRLSPVRARAKQSSHPVHK
jgi:hypothetical protein